MKASAVIFDCDGVLVNTEELVVGLERAHLARVGLIYDHNEFLTRFTGLSEPDFYAVLDADRRERISEGLPEGFQKSIDDAKWPLFEAKLKAITGVADLVFSLPMLKAVASSASASDLVRKLHMAKIHDLFDPHIYSTELVEMGKPAPDIYLLVARELDCAAEDCLVIEDSVNGVMSGVAAGMTVWGFTGGGHADPGLRDRLLDSGATAVFDSYGAIGSWLCTNYSLPTKTKY